ncbi:hypothetical protein EX30DRAFT_110932 [Ascodesmis nigricans]|uniref:C2H2-type domain-containing protein n=1 Tax=Ascodesmis nigricans TaxID=341454 RepID=A0A4S2MSQ9_9PEZI|nr:hypothetical protein EX30DRAFT_110932 [Ascodesmis nigricans]
MSHPWGWNTHEENEHQATPHSHHQPAYFTQDYTTPMVEYTQQPLPSTFIHNMSHGPYSPGHAPPVGYTDPNHGYLTPNFTTSYHESPRPSPGFASDNYTSRPGSNYSPGSEIYDDFEDDALEPIYYTDPTTGLPQQLQQPPYTSSSSSSHHPPPGTSPYYMCDHPGCNKVCARLCDLRKHKKRHQKPFPCREGCESCFSTEKDRDRHERSRHRQEERLTCVVCGHRTARKDNMKDHVRRRHGEQDLERIMDATIANAYGDCRTPER